MVLPVPEREQFVVLTANGPRLDIAETYGWPDTPREANAKLIAAAPDMHAVLDELEDCFDREIYPEQAKEDFDAPDDREYTVTITAKQWHALGRVLNKVENG